jgi:N12 class adenine-specific DNA methylase
MVLGTPSGRGKMNAAGQPEYTVEGGPDFEAKLEAAINSLPEGIAGEVERGPEEKKLRVTGAKAGSYLAHKDGIYRADAQGEAVKVTKDNGEALSAAETAKARGLIDIRDAAVKQLELETKGRSDEEINENRAALNKHYDKFVKQFGWINETKNGVIDDDPEWALLSSLEDDVVKTVEKMVKGKKTFRRDTTYKKGTLLLRRSNPPPTEPETATSIEDALALSLVWRGGVKPSFMARLLGKTEAEVTKMLVDDGLAYYNPETGLIETAESYLSGFVRDKLAAAKRAAEGDPEKFKANVEALEKAQPEDIPIETLSSRLGSSFIPPTVVANFLHEVMGVRADVKFDRALDSIGWSFDNIRGENSTANEQTWQAGGVSGHEMVLDSLNLKLTEVGEWVKEPNKHPKWVVDIAKTAAARDRQKAIQEEFRRWLLNSPRNGERVAESFNRLHNGIKARETKVPNIAKFPNASDALTLYYWQKRAAYRALTEGLMLAHSVGTGKTSTLITIAAEMKRLGIANKPMVVVQNSTLGQFARTFKQMYPSAKILVGDAKQTKGERRREFIARAATGEWDTVIIPQSFFERLPNEPGRERDYVRARLDEIDEAIAEAERKEGGKPENIGNTRKMVSALGKRLLKVRKRYAVRLERILDRIRTRADDLLTFDMLGVDALLVDEAHNYKRGDFYTKMDPIKGLDTNGSDRSMDFLMKTMYIHDKTPNRNVILATGTPISNTLAEMWTMMRYIRPDLIEKFNVSTFDSRNMPTGRCWERSGGPARTSMRWTARI